MIITDRARLHLGHRLRTACDIRQIIKHIVSVLFDKDSVHAGRPCPHKRLIIEHINHIRTHCIAKALFELFVRQR